jgi:hypothetical protein
MPWLDRGIQYSRGIEMHPDRRGVLDRPVKPGDDVVLLSEDPCYRG